jgi:hypothetical protein
MWMQPLARPKANSAVVVSQLTTVALEGALSRKVLERSLSECERDRDTRLFCRHLWKQYTMLPVSADRFQQIGFSR